MDVKEKYAMRYTLHRGLYLVTNWVRFKFAAMNLIIRNSEVDSSLLLYFPLLFEDYC